MNGHEKSTAELTLKAAPPLTKGWAIARAMKHGARFGILLALVLGLGAGISIVTHLLDQFDTMQRSGHFNWSLIASRLFGLIAVILVFASIPPILFGLAAALNARPRDGSNPFDADQDEPRSFSNRLRHFLDDTAPPGLPNDQPNETAPRSRMAFFMAFIPSRRTSPKSAGYIREVLWRIHRLVRGSS